MNALGSSLFIVFLRVEHVIFAFSAFEVLMVFPATVQAPDTISVPSMASVSHFK